MFTKRTTLFLIVIAALFSLMTYQSRKGYSLTGGLLSPLLNGISAAVTTVTDAVSLPFREIALTGRENRALRKQNDELLLERMRYQEALIENRRLRDMMKLQETWKNPITVARVIARASNYWSHALVIGKGQDAGIVKDATAITPKGLAGKITGVSSSSATLLLLTDINFSASVRLQESRKEGVLSGTGTSRTMLKYIPPEEEVKTGEVVITSGLDRLFPPGIPVGYVSRVDRGGTGQFQSIEVVPFVETSRIEEVLIVK